MALPFVEEREWKRQSKAVQRHLPRPTDINDSILRGAPHKDQKYRALYEVGFMASCEGVILRAVGIAQHNILLCMWQ